MGNLYQQFGYSLIGAFFAYTPFLRSEVVLRFTPLVVKVLASIGLKYFKVNARRMVESVTWLSEEKRALSYS